MDPTGFEVLSFDCHGTLIDGESGIAAVLGPWAAESGLELSDEELLVTYADREAEAARETPGAAYPDILATASDAPASSSVPR